MTLQQAIDSAARRAKTEQRTVYVVENHGGYYTSLKPSYRTLIATVTANGVEYHASLEVVC